MKDRRGIQSIEIGNKILFTLAEHRAPMTLKHLAEAAELSTGKIYPYLVSFVNLGLMVQHREGGVYDLGPMCLHLGLHAMQRHQPLKIAINEATLLAAETKHSTAIAVWGNQGPTITYFEESGYPLHVYLRPGTVMSLLNTATGLVFSAFMEPKLIQQELKSESCRFGGEKASNRELAWEEIEARLSTIRQAGFSRAQGLTVTGINALSAPIFDRNGRICLALTLMGPGENFDSSDEGLLAKTLLNCSQRISTLLGYSE